jgi:hypothetical protein
MTKLVRTQSLSVGSRSKVRSGILKMAPYIYMYSISVLEGTGVSKAKMERRRIWKYHANAAGETARSNQRLSETMVAQHVGMEEDRCRRSQYDGQIVRCWQLLRLTEYRSTLRMIQFTQTARLVYPRTFNYTERTLKHISHAAGLFVHWPFRTTDQSPTQRELYEPRAKASVSPIFHLRFSEQMHSAMSS